jgi:SAM-dependent methyltransferase
MLAPALSILLSSFLIFLVQPILAKQILPWFGGSAGVWSICLVFFQVMLLLGYAYAHLLTRRCGRRRQLMVHILLLLGSCIALPIIPSSYWNPGPDTEPTLRILGLLASTVGLPYFMLASTAPLLQRWLSASGGNSNERTSIYRLFALSNFGSLIGLVSYPFTIEPFATVRTQALVWSGGYSLFVISLVSYAWRRNKLLGLDSAVAPSEAAAASPPSLTTYAYWVGCAALGSSLLLSVTNQITQNVASIPFLWIIPLSIYLFSFVICFEGRAGRGWYERQYWLVATMLAIGAMSFSLAVNQTNLSVLVQLPIFIVGLFFGCVMCHGELAQSKPAPDYLTQFYLALAAGGALGGVLVGLVAPQIFTNYWELPLSLVALTLLAVHALPRDRPQGSKSWTVNAVAASVATTLILLFLGALPSILDPVALAWSKIVLGDARWGCAVLLGVCALLMQKHGLSRAICLTALLCTIVFCFSYYHSRSSGNVIAERNFYGTLRVIDSPFNGTYIRRLNHGTIIHGSQVLDSPDRLKPTTYYGEASGVGRALLASHRFIGSLRIGTIGLGVGTLAAYGKQGDTFSAYELNPAVLDIARAQFTYLKDSAAKIELVLGDGRLSLERQIAGGRFDLADQRFNLLAIDAFSGDAIPVHLLTREAFAVYARTLAPEGIIAFHLSNQYLDLPPVVQQLASDAGFKAILISDRPAIAGLTSPSDWVLVSRNTFLFDQPEIAGSIAPIVPRSRSSLWTDEFSNLFQILK